MFCYRILIFVFMLIYSHLVVERLSCDLLMSSTQTTACVMWNCSLSLINIELDLDLCCVSFIFILEHVKTLNLWLWFCNVRL